MQQRRLEAIVDRIAPDLIIHTAAALSARAAGNPSQAIRINLASAAHLLDLARTRPGLRLIFSGSGTVAYRVSPFPDGGKLGEDFRMSVLSEAPTSVYAATKLWLEQLVQIYRLSFGVEALVLRFGAILGAMRRDDPGMIARLCVDSIAALDAGDADLIGAAYRWQGAEELVDPRDCAAAIHAAASISDWPVPVIGISTGRPLSFEAYLAEIGLPPPTGLADSPALWEPRSFFRPGPTDLGVASSLLNFAPAFGVREALLHCRSGLARLEGHPAPSPT